MSNYPVTDSQLSEFKENYIIPPEIESILKNALEVRADIANSFDESEKKRLPYTKIKSSIDSHIAGILQKCHKK